MANGKKAEPHSRKLAKLVLDLSAQVNTLAQHDLDLQRNIDRLRHDVSEQFEQERKTLRRQAEAIANLYASPEHKVTKWPSWAEVKGLLDEATALEWLEREGARIGARDNPSGLYPGHKAIVMEALDMLPRVSAAIRSGIYDKAPLMDLRSRVLKLCDQEPGSGGE